MQEYDVIIVGSGIAGMTAAIYLKRAGLNTLIIEESAPGGQLNRSSIIENYPGFLNIDGPSLAMNIYKQITNLNIDYLYEKVINIDVVGQIKKVYTTNKTLLSKYIIIASGRSPRKLNLANENKYIGTGISFCALCDGRLYKNKNIIVIGGGNGALEEALYLSNICAKVTIIHRKNSFNADGNVIDRINFLSNIKVIFNANVIKYNIVKDKITSVTLDNNKKIKTDGIFISIGYIPTNEYLKVKQDKGYIVVDNNYSTSVKNIYACGDCIKKNTYQLTTAVGEATNVAHNIITKENNK